MHSDCSIPAHEPKSWSPKTWKLTLHSVPKLHNAVHCSKYVIWNRALEKKIISKAILLKILKFPTCTWDYANICGFPGWKSSITPHVVSPVVIPVIIILGKKLHAH